MIHHRELLRNLAAFWLATLSLSLPAVGQDPPTGKVATATVESAGASLAPSPPPATPEPSQMSAAGTVSGVEPAAEPSLEPPDGKWLVDEEGNEYFLTRVAKSSVIFVRMGDNQVRFRWGTFTPESEDDQAFYFKVLREGTIAQPPPQTRKKNAAATPDDQPVNEPPMVSRMVWEARGEGLPTSGQWRNGFELADMNEDGHLDIVHGPARKTYTGPVVFLGDGKGGWSRWAAARFPNLGWDYGDVAVADFNRDGHLDIAVAVHLRGILVVVGDGKGNFREWGRGLDFSVAGPGRPLSPFSSKAIVAVDWNRDGRLDLLAQGEGPRLNTSRPDQRKAGDTGARGVAIYLNQGDGTWKRGDLPSDNPREVFGDEIAVGDLNGDRVIDFATASHSLGNRDILNLGKRDGKWDRLPISQLARGYIWSVRIADLDGDRRPELLIGSVYRTEDGYWRTALDVVRVGRDGVLKAENLLTRKGRSGIFGITVADLDKDGVRDVAALSGDGEVWLLWRQADGNRGLQVLANTDEGHKGCQGYEIEAADFDGDGNLELVANMAGENSAMFAPDSCTEGGAIRVWSSKRVASGGR